MVGIIKAKTPVGTTEISFLANQDQIIKIGNRTSNGVAATHTPAAGKTFVLIAARMSASGVGGDFSYSGSLRVNSVIQETGRLGFVAAGNGLPMIYDFILKGLRVVGDGAQAIDINLGGITGGSMTVEGTIYGYEIDT